MLKRTGAGVCPYGRDELGIDVRTDKSFTQRCPSSEKARPREVKRLVGTFVRREEESVEDEYENYGGTGRMNRCTRV